mmetsp:Transcript_40361/g.89621  ORF Transcript_40361/g.89621 Transcript_40361/m.89621 type:complete len:290 (+) Transcript_40361:118-987(+)|eukprot:CAMPEP_0202891818 /NCGR_PEP_ID=MMETSP1392-20130828/1769_1 /ASSEMBLY_ACC=CAM_ASM_000868 /TAXON_ID=225041 /ORGANISM="Chlamydomonas chlamydogama, Strain SAG 11-48b" /LENGTH=289 /DNA_ID=CAMNT_0049575677 /DNA_START=92 /DNA_END=961 /DNA_ORIENTATION=+
MEADPLNADEALARQLHRELNGLKRTSRSSRGDVGLQDKLGDSRAAPRSKTDGRASSYKKTSANNSEESDSGESSLQSEERENGRLAKRQRKTEPSLDTKNVKPARQQSAGHTEPPRKPPEPKKPSTQDKVQDSGKVAAAEAADISTRPSQQQPTTAAAQQPAAPKTTVQHAAAAASQVVRDRARQGTKNGPRMIKCFHAGVRWGITLAPDQLKSRTDLAVALNFAFADEILACGRGDSLSIVFLDQHGNTYEFPSLRSVGPGEMRASDDMKQWKRALGSAVKVYVRRG